MNKKKEQAEQKQTLDTENILTAARWGGVGEMGEPGEGVKYKSVVQNSHGDGKCNRKHIVSNSLIIMYSVYG